MPRSALIFLVAIFLPSLVLGWLALRTAGEQRILIERQEVNLRQSETDAAAAQVRMVMDQKQQLFAETIRSLTAQHGASALAESYDILLHEVWADSGVPFAVAPDGALAFPSAAQGRANSSFGDFRANSAAFLSNRSTEEVFQMQQVVKGKTGTSAESKNAATPSPAEKAEKRSLPVEPKSEPASGSSLADKTLRKMPSVPTRNVAPQKEAARAADLPVASKVAPEFSNFQNATQGATQGIIARFVQNELEVLLWTKPDPRENWIFGVMLAPAQIRALLGEVLPDNSYGGTELAILDERARPVVQAPAGFTADWKRPFVATEIGEALPQWEVALYLTNPDKLTNSARLVTMTLVLLIALALAAILGGGFFVVRDTRHQLALAQKKTDFVSNVSHELKTPLTSIRLFAEMLSDGRVNDPQKQHRYLRIISSESERLTRLVNNVLDFARMEKGRKTYQRTTTDIRPLIAGLWEREEERLREKDFAAEWIADPGAYSVHCDPDAVLQVLVNLLSNAEKYSNGSLSITLRTHLEKGRLVIAVEDRGPGLPRGMEEKIFEPFFRADDSLASGVQGSGLGLTLARRIARDHDGDLTARPRDGGGSIFTFTLPLA